jgi:hypothetical protein
VQVSTAQRNSEDDENIDALPVRLAAGRLGASPSMVRRFAVTFYWRAGVLLVRAVHDHESQRDPTRRRGMPAFFV